jgi:hypothetical protein
MAAAAAWSVGAQAQPVYKWVDAEGKTHYGSQPPPAKQDAEPLKLQSNNGTSGGSTSSGNKGASAKAGQQYNPDGTKKVSKDVEEFGEGLKKSLGTVDSQQVPLNCAVAVDNIHYQADLMLEVGQKNVRDGYMTQAAFDSAAPKIREAKGKYSVSDCQGASGNKKSFYQCMSSSKNHVTGCDKQYKH